MGRSKVGGGEGEGAEVGQGTEVGAGVQIEAEAGKKQTSIRQSLISDTVIHLYSEEGEIQQQGKSASWLELWLVGNSDEIIDDELDATF